MNQSSAGGLKGKKVIVVGLGTSGQAALDLLVRRGAKVVGTDRLAADKFPKALFKMGAELVLGGHQGVDFSGADLIVISPGVPTFVELETAEAAGVEVIGETELASRFLDAPLFAVGGTNGKSTCTTLLGHLLEGADQKVFVGGNLGEPACDAVEQGVDSVVFEVSSFQMERLRTFRPHVAILLNVTEDHLDRYPDFASYAKAKGNCFQQQTPDDFAIIPTMDEICLAQATRGKAKIITFGPGGDYTVDGLEVVEVKTGERFDLRHSDLHGRHNHLNAAAAIAAARVAKLPASAISEGLRRFRALPHRMGLSGKHKGVTFYDDSKATNVGAAVTALRGLTEPQGVLIAGGRDKMGSYDDLVLALAEKGRGAVLLGEAAERLAKAIGTTVPIQRANSLEGAVIRAFRMARPGDAVLLSPACSSLDMFKNYSERGDRFTEAVRSLPTLLKEDEE